MPDQGIAFKQVDIADTELEIIRSGKGRPLLYLHDGGGIEHNMRFIEMLSCHYAVHAPSHPGFGGSSLPAGCNTVDDLAYFYLDYIEREGLDDIILVGASFGGWIAAEMAIKASTAITSLVLIDALGVKFGGRDKHDVADIFYLLPEQVRALGYHSQPPKIAVSSIESARRMARNRESLSLFGWSPLLHNPKLRGRLHRISVPTLVLWGASDRIAPVEFGRKYAADIKGARFELIDAAGHLPNVEQPDATCAALHEFLK